MTQIPDNLRGRTLLIGRAPGKDRLLVCTTLKGQSLAAEVTGVSGVPQSVSRCKVQEGTAHLRLSIGPGGETDVENLKAENVTYVNDNQVTTKRVSISDKLSLGRDRFSVSVEAILSSASALVTKVEGKSAPPPQPVNIKPLERVWEEHQARQDAINRRQQRMMRLRMVPMGIGLLSGAIAGIASAQGASGIRNVTIVLTFISLSIFIYNMLKKDTTYEDRKAADDQLMDDYVCPNTNCRHYLGKQPYKLLRQNKVCPYCKVPWTEE